MKVPLALRTIIGKREIVRSLRAASHRQAVEHLRAVSVEIDRLFREAEGKLKAPSLSPILQPGSQRPATDDDVRRLTREWFWSNERASIEHERAAPVEDVADALHIAEVELSLFRDAADPNTAMAAYTITRDVLEAGKLTAAPGSPVWSLAEALAQRAIVEQLAQYVARLKGDHRGIVSDPAFAGADAFTPPPKPAPLLSICIQKFIDEHRAGWTAKTKHRHVTTLDLFLAVVQDKPITRITADDVRSFKDVLVALPANVSKLPNLKRLSPVAAAEVAGKRGMTPMAGRTAKQKLGIVKAFLQWCTDSGYLAVNPVPGNLTVKLSKRAVEERDPFTIEQLRRIFQSPLYKGCVSPGRIYEPGTVILRDSAKYWLPLLGLFTGCRLSELGQLRCIDVIEEEGFPALQIAAIEGDEVEAGLLATRKTPQSERTMPLHPRLVEAGFLDFVQRQRDKGHTRLFPDLRPGSDQYLSGPFGKWFARLLAHVDAKTDTTSFHSFRHNFFRHNFEDAAEAASLSEKMIDRLQGHKVTGMKGRYGSREYPIAVTAPAVARITFAGLDLEHLRPG